MKALLFIFLIPMLCRGAITVGNFDVTDPSINPTSGVPNLIYGVATSVAAIQSQIATQGLASAVSSSQLSQSNSLWFASQTNSIVSKTTNYTLTSGDQIVLMNGALSATLLSAVGIPGREFTVKCVSAGTNAILTTSSQTIDGAAKWTNTAINKFTRVVSDGANWKVIGSN